MNAPVNDVVKFAEQKRDSYKKDAGYHQAAFFISEIAAVTLLGITPILALTTDKLFPAITSSSGIIAGLSTKYKWRTSWMQCKKTSEAMDYEISLFKIEKDVDQDKEKLLIDKIREIEFNHINNWENDTLKDEPNHELKNSNEQESKGG
jgi:hypothetical protein